jgi:DmsE family decaheme c-type cytochrome
MMQYRKRWIPLAVSLAAFMGVAGSVSAAEPTLLAAVSSAGKMDGYAAGDETTCLDCHDETSDYPVLSILKTPHASKADARAPFSRDGCQTCHGAAGAHVEDESDLPRIPFGPDAPVDAQNEVCLSCHQGNVAMHWIGGAHESAGLACASCHTIHVGEEEGGDPILSKNVDRGRKTNAQAEVCFTCHREKRARAYRNVAHPIRYGQMNCSDCHSPHGSMGPSQLVKPTLNETCYTCHAEKRGPFLWEHAPAREDCSNCHTAHGSNHASMLVTKVNQLCQQCHMASYHPSTVYDGADTVPLGGNDYHILSRGCPNCHTDVHGSNHPAGARWTR